MYGRSMVGLAGRWVVPVVASAVALTIGACADVEKNPATDGGRGGAGQGTGGSGASSGGKGSSGSGGGPGGASGLADFHRQFWAALCERQFRCTLPDDDEIAIKNLLGTERRCVSMVEQGELRSARFSDLVQKVSTGAIRFVPAAVASCLEEARSCSFANRNNLSRSGPACRDVFEGTVPLGGACHRAEECAGDAHCSIALACPGTCVARQPAGGSCDVADDCDDSRGYQACRSDPTLPNLVCVPIAVAAAAKVGAPCTAVLGDGTTFVPCETGSWCDGDDLTSPSTGICRLPLASGTPCDDADTLCVDGDSCFDRASCKPLRFGSNVGDDCNDDTGPWCDPFARLSCVSGKCQTLGDGKAGSACSTGDIHGQFDCEPGTLCITNDPNLGATCRTLLGAGAPCQHGPECVSGTCASATCAAEYCGD
jgi:hypothetical protein